MSKQVALTPYRTGRAGRRWRPVSLIFMLVYCAATGCAIALLPAQLLFLLAIPLFIAVPVILWLMPDGGKVPDRLLATLLVCFIAANVLWPTYLAVDLPGLPWINPPRLFVFLLLTLGLFSYSTSSAVRRRIAGVLGSMKTINVAFWMFWAISLATVVLSPQPAFSLNKWANNQIFWTFMFLAAAWLGTRDGTMSRVVKIIAWTSILVALETMYEYHIQEVPWADHIPSFLKVDESFLNNVLKSQARAGTDIYRAHATFAVSLVYAEYLALVYPFLIHVMLEAKDWFRRSAMLLVLVAVVSAMWLTGARSAMIGFFFSVFLYGGFAAFRHWRRNRQSIVGATTMAMMPIAAGVFFALALTWPRLHSMTFGGGQHQPSTEARKTQWAMGTPIFERQPVGHGPGMAGNVLGFVSPNGQMTIDTYYLSLLLEYGVAGFVAFLVMIGGQAVYGMRIFLAAAPGEENLAGPVSIALINFLVIQSVLSSEFNMPIAFIFLGFLFAIAWRQKQRLGTAAQAPAATGYGALAAA